MRLSQPAILARFLGVATLALSACAALGQATPAPMQFNADYKVTNRFAVPGEGNWDYISIDSASRRINRDDFELACFTDAQHVSRAARRRIAHRLQRDVAVCAGDVHVRAM